MTLLAPLAALHLGLALVGMADVAVAPSRADRPLGSFQRSLAGLDRPSDRTVETVKRLGLEAKYRRDPANVLSTLEPLIRTNPDPDVVYALAELSWVEARRLDRRHHAESIDRTVDALAYSHDYLFAPELAHARQPSDPRYRLACDLYNGSLDRLLREALGNGGKIAVGDDFALKVREREQVFRVSLADSPWTAADVQQVVLASGFEVSGLPTLNYQYGLGVPLIAIRKSPPKPEGAERFYPPEMAFPLTAFIRPPSKINPPPAPRGTEPNPELVVDLVDPLRVRNLRTPDGSAMPTESDLTTPLAYMWSHSDLSRFRWTGLLRPGPSAGRAGLMLIRPYEPGKIPVVMVHGLASSPLAWVAMVNDLLRDPRIQERYQFMLYLYPTGIPVPIAAAGLRDALAEAEAEPSFRRPDGTPDPGFHQMVLLGHSMGGLLSHAATVDSAQKWWELNTYVPIDRIKGPDYVIDELKRYMFFEAPPYVRRVVFLATPHRGSDLSRRMVGRVSSSLISEPDYISNLLVKLVRDNPDAFPKRFRRLPTSIDTLDTDSPYLQALLTMQPGPGVTYHSIIGSLRPEGKQNTTDGVVPYKSSHLDGVASEVVVQSDHSVQNNPYAIMEVHRILLEHVGLGAAPATAPVAAGTGRAVQ